MKFCEGVTAPCCFSGVSVEAYGRTVTAFGERAREVVRVIIRMQSLKQYLCCVHSLQMSLQAHLRHPPIVVFIQMIGISYL